MEIVWEGGLDIKGLKIGPTKVLLMAQPGSASPVSQDKQTASSSLRGSEKEMDNLAVNEIIKRVDGEILRNTNKLNESRARLEKFTEVGFAQGNSLVDKEQELIDNRKKSLEEAEGLRKSLEGITDFNEVLNILKSYSHKPTFLQEEVLNATVRNVLEFNKNSVILVDNPSALERIFSPGLKHAAETIILAEGVNERRAIILVSSDLTTASQLVMVLPHEAWHTKSALNYNNPIHRYLGEGITTYLEKKSIDKIIAEEPQIAELIEQELAHIKIPEIKIPETPEEKLRRVMFPETQQERLFKKLYPFFDYKTEVTTVVTLASKFGEPFIMHIYTTGGLDILKDKLGERFDFLNSIASFSVPAWVEQWAVRNALHFIFVDDSFNKTKLKAFKEVLTAIKYVTGKVYNKYCGSMDWDETQAYLKRLSAVIGSMDSIKKYTEARLAKKIDLKQLREGLGLEVKTFSEEFVRKLANGQNGKTSGSPVILPAFDKITKSILDYLPSDQKVIVNVQSNFESKEVTTTVADALAVAKDSGVVSVQIKRIPPVRANTVPVESAANKFEANWITQWVDDEVLNVMVQFASGQTAAFYGNKEMLLELANQSEVMRVIPSEAPQWMRTAYQTPQEERAANADWLGKLANGFGSGVVMTSQEANIAGMEVYHGTIASLADSAKAGPKNVGKGFGGRGLYLAAQGERDIAEYLASIAAIEHRDSVSYLSGEVAVNQNAGREPVILSGKINPKRQLRVGKFTVKGEVTIPDLINGVLPALWDNDPNLRVLLEREFDVLDLWDMHSSGLVIDTDHMLVVHERAGADAIIWEASSALNNLSGDKTGGIDGSTAPTINSSDKQGKGGIDLSNIELILKDDSYVSNLAPADLKVLRAAKALKDGWDSLSLLYIHEIILLLSRQAMKRQAGSRLLPDSFAGKDNLANGITNKALLSQVLKQLQTKDFLDPQAAQFLQFIQAEKLLSEITTAEVN